MGKRAKRIGGVARQCAALPTAEHGDELYVLLVTSRETARWVVPKGWAEKRLSGSELAAKEAFEEAGIVGSAEATPIGVYHYDKRLPKGRVVVCEVTVYRLAVLELRREWPEQGQRLREWFTLAQAASVVDEPELRSLLLGLKAPLAAI